MEISLITELPNKLWWECDICHMQKNLEYLIMDEKNEMYSVCRECKHVMAVKKFCKF